MLHEDILLHYMAYNNVILLKSYTVEACTVHLKFGDSSPIKSKTATLKVNCSVLSIMTKSISVI